MKVQKSYINTHNESYERLMRISELENELSNLRSSCNDSFLNTVDRANQLSLKCASLENTIAEFDVYKKDAQEVHDMITKLYEAEVAAKKELSSKLWHSRRDMAKLKRDLVDATIQIAELGDKYSSAERERSEYESLYNSILAQYAELKVKLNAIEQDKAKARANTAGLEWAKWVATDENGEVYAYKEKPSRDEGEWRSIGSMSWQFYADDHAIVIALCGRLPRWEDEEPTPVKNK